MMKFYFDFGPNNSSGYPRYTCFNINHFSDLHNNLTSLSLRARYQAHSIIAVAERGPQWIKNRNRYIGKHNCLLTDDELKDFTWQVLSSTTFNK